MISLEFFKQRIQSPCGSLPIAENDEITRKLAMLIEGECGSQGIDRAAAKFGFSRQRYFQLPTLFLQKGGPALLSSKRGPKSPYRRTQELVCQVIRHRFLDPEASTEVIAQKLRQCNFRISKRTVDRVIAQFGLQKKLYQFHPQRPPVEVETFRTVRQDRREKLDHLSLERGVRQLLADKVSGNLVGLWLLLPEHLRVGTWDLLTGWAGPSPSDLSARLALQLVHEAALGVVHLRTTRTLTQKGFELLNGLPFVASDQSIHDLLQAHTVPQAEELQFALGCLRRARGHFQGRLLALDPHRLPSASKRQMPRYRDNSAIRPYKVSTTFFCLHVETQPPICFFLTSASMTVSQITPPLLHLAARILNPAAESKPLVLADTEHYTEQLFASLSAHSPFDLLVPMRSTQTLTASLELIPPQEFQPRWAGWATTHRPFHFQQHPETTYCQLVQRSGENSQTFDYKAFLASRYRDEVLDLAINYPQRWHVEEFFNAYQALGWKRAGTLNLNVRFGQMCMALIAQTVCHQLHKRLGDPFASWDAPHFASAIFRGIDGDIRVCDNTIVVTLYNAPNPDLLKKHYENLPQILEREKVDPRIPWLYNFKLDFRFR